MTVELIPIGLHLCGSNGELGGPQEVIQVSRVPVVGEVVTFLPEAGNLANSKWYRVALVVHMPASSSVVAEVYGIRLTDIQSVYSVAGIKL
jgi:hypothetical protein